MATTVSFNGSSYSIPAVGNRNWGTGVTNFLIAVAGNALSKSGGNFTLTADVNFGANYGLIAKYLKSVSSNIAQSGILRLANNEGIAWRNAANGADKTLKVDASDKLTFGSAAVSEAELGYLSGVTSALQTQLGGKEASLSAGTTDQYYRGDKSWQDLATAVAATAAVTANTAKVSAAGSIGTHSDVDVATDAPVTGDVLTYDGTNWVPGTGGSGSGSKNYVENPSASGDTSGWSTSGTMTIDRVDDDHVDAANRPRANTTGTCFKASGGAADDYTSFDFTLDDVDERAANLLAKLAANVTDASTWKVQLFAYSDSARTADETEITPVDADSNGDWFLAATTADFTTFWTPNPSLPYMQLRIVDTVGGSTIYWSDTLVGPGDATSGAAVTDWEPYTPSSTQGFGTITACTLEWKQDGTDMLIRGGFTTGTVAATEAQIGLPDGYTVGGTSTNSEVVGDWLTNATTDDAYYVLATKGDSFLNVSRMDNAAAYIPLEPRSGSQIAVSSTRVSITARIPITEWVRSGTVGLGTNRVEYWSHDGTSVVRGRDGALVPTTTPAGSTDDYSLTGLADSAAARGAIPRLEMLLGDGSGGTVGTWVPVPNNYIEDLWTDSMNVYGAGLTTGSEVGLRRGKYRRGNSTSWATLPSGTRWRVVVTAPGVVTGYGQATADTYGLVKGGKVPGVTDGSAREAGYVGESTESIVTTLTNATGAYQNLASITLTAGDWDISAMASLFFNTASVEYMEMAISTNSASITGTQYGYDYLQHFINASAGSSRNSTATIPRKVVSITADTTYYLVVKAVYASATAQWRGNISARRVR